MEAIGTAAIGIGFSACVYGIARGLRSLAWPTVIGEVTDSDVEFFRGRGSVLYTPRIRYSYQVGGRAYDGNRVVFGYPDYHTRRGADSVIAAYPVGGTVRVHYDPSDPGSAVLRPGVGIRTWIAAGFMGALLLLVFGALAGLYGAA